MSFPISTISSLTTSALAPRTATTNSSSSTSSSSSASSQTSLNSLGSTFLQLLTQELKNQDPTAPVDSTQMVGQMISLNQLDQLASINQTLTTQFPTPAAATSSTTTATTKAIQAGTAAASQTAAVQAALQALNTGAAANITNSLVSLPAL